MLRCVGVLCCVVVVFFISETNGFAREPYNPTTAAIFYDAYITKTIAKYEHKEALQTSKLAAIRRAAALAMLKSTYLQEYRAYIIEEMQQNRIDPQPHKVHVFLNQKFFEIVR